MVVPAVRCAATVINACVNIRLRLQGENTTWDLARNLHNVPKLTDQQCVS
jgi:hypothetical protein